MATPGLGLEITELRLGLPCMGGKSKTAGVKSTEKKRAFWEIDVEEDGSSTTTDENNQKGDSKVGTKGSGNQVVIGWPPVCSYRKKNSFNGRENGSKTYVKVSMDGAPILRKIDLGSFTEYSHLTMALQKLFHCFDHSNAGEKLKDAENIEYVTIYEDKDGDWMLVGDVPWEMFIESCKRLRIMKNADAKDQANQRSFASD